MLYAVGDVHGHGWKLVSLLSKLPLTPDDRLVFLGDYIDRGPESRQVLDLLIGLREQRPETIFLRGNHEQMMLDARDRRHDPDPMALWFSNGGAETVDSYPQAPGGWIERIPAEHWGFVEQTTLEYWEGAHAFVHAGFLPEGAPWPYKEDPRLWIREDFIRHRGDFGATVVFGHTPQMSGRPLVMDNKIGIDTAAAFGGPLTAVALEAGAEPRFFQS